MRTKEEIFTQLKQLLPQETLSYQQANLISTTTLEALIDIRDILNDLNKSFGSNILDLAKES